jgi:membrane protease YdiL (CAAX protease family)
LKRGCAGALALSILLITYSSVVALPAFDERASVLIWVNLLILAALVAASRAAGFSLRDLGMSARGLPASAAVGIAAGVLLAALPVAFILVIPFWTDAIQLDDLSQRSADYLAMRVGVFVPVGTAFFEEGAFRGVLYGLVARRLGDRGALLWTSAAFALWHIVISSRTVMESGLAESVPLVALGVILSLGGTFVGGLAFAYLRWRTGSIVAPFFVHWLAVALMTTAVWLRA